MSKIIVIGSGFGGVSAAIRLAAEYDRKIIVEKGRAASRRILTHYTEEHYRRTVNAVYEAVAAKCRPASS